MNNDEIKGKFTIQVVHAAKPVEPVVMVAKLADVSYINVIVITCKYCASKNVVKYGKKGEIQYYLCKDCSRTFAGNNALEGMRFPSDRIATALRLFYEGLSIDKIRRNLTISTTSTPQTLPFTSG